MKLSSSFFAYQSQLSGFWSKYLPNDMKLKVVDGFNIRNSLDIEFGVIGDRAIYPYIPAGEIWLERYFLPEKDAILESFRRKKRLSRRHGYEKAKALLRPKRTDLGARKKCRKTVLCRMGPIKIILVDGRLVRRRLDPNFCFGGHYLVYKYVPRSEVWLDDTAGPELKYVAIHELFELSLMQHGKDYANAHEFANAAEKEARRRDGIARYPKD